MLGSCTIRLRNRLKFVDWCPLCFSLLLLDKALKMMKNMENTTFMLLTSVSSKLELEKQTNLTLIKNYIKFVKSFIFKAFHMIVQIRIIFL